MEIVTCVFPSRVKVNGQLIPEFLSGSVSDLKIIDDPDLSVLIFLVFVKPLGATML